MRVSCFFLKSPQVFIPSLSRCHERHTTKKCKKRKKGEKFSYLFSSRLCATQSWSTAEIRALARFLPPLRTPLRACSLPPSRTPSLLRAPLRVPPAPLARGPGRFPGPTVATKKLDDPVMHQPREPCEMYPYFSPKLYDLPCELLYLRLKTAPDDGVCWHTNRPKDVDFQKMKKRCEKLSFRAKIEKWEQRYGGKQLRRMNKETQNVKYLKGVNFFSQ